MNMSGFFGHRRLHNMFVPIKLSQAPPAVSQRGILRFLADQLAFYFPGPPHYKAGLPPAPGRWGAWGAFILFYILALLLGITNLRKIDNKSRDYRW